MARVRQKDLLQLTVPISGFVNVSASGNDNFYTITSVPTMPGSPFTAKKRRSASPISVAEAKPKVLSLANDGKAPGAGKQIVARDLSDTPSVDQLWCLVHADSEGHGAFIVSAAHPDLCLQVPIGGGKEPQLQLASRSATPSGQLKTIIWSLFPACLCSDDPKKHEGTFYIHPQSSFKHIAIGDSLDDHPDDSKVVEFDLLSRLSVWKFTFVGKKP